MTIEQILTPPKVIAVVGLSDKTDRPSYQVAAYLQSEGFTIIPVNPTITETMGLKSYSSISEISKDIKIDIVDIFRRSEEVPAIVQEVINSNRRPIIWMQESIISEESKKTAEVQGMEVVMDKCMMKMHRALHSGQ